MAKVSSTDAKNKNIAVGRNKLINDTLDAKENYRKNSTLSNALSFIKESAANMTANISLTYNTTAGVIINALSPVPDNDNTLGVNDGTNRNVGKMDNDGISNSLETSKLDDFFNVNTVEDLSTLTLNETSNDYAKTIYHANNMFSERERNKLGGIFNKTYRFGYYNTNTVSTGKEFLFFTKPDLNIMTNVLGVERLNPFLADTPFWINLLHDKPDVIKALQFSYSGGTSKAGDGYDETSDIFNHLLQNQVVSSLDIPSLSAQMTETAVNDYGVGYNYRGSSESSDDNPDFSLEFKDNKWLDTYMFFKAYEMYETMKHHGQVAPKKEYITDRIIHDAFAIFKFIVAEDMETIIYFGKMYGVTPKSLPRDSFSNATFDSGITYNIDFQAAFYEDMVPDIITDFNALSYKYYMSRRYRIDVYNERLGMADGRAAQAAIVVQEKSNLSPSGYVYKLKWRGDDKV